MLSAIDKKALSRLEKLHVELLRDNRVGIAADLQALLRAVRAIRYEDGVAPPKKEEQR